MQSRWRLVSGHQILFHETEEGINSLQRVLGGNIAVYMDGIGYVEPSRVGHSPSEAEKRDLEVCELSCKFVQEGNTLGTTFWSNWNLLGAMGNPSDGIPGILLSNVRESPIFGICGILIDSLESCWNI